MTENEFLQQCVARLNDVGDEHPDVKARVKEFNRALSVTRHRHAILMQKDESSIKRLQSYALMVDVNEGRASYHQNMFDKTFYKYNKPQTLCR